MPRRPRLHLPSLPLHLVQRGNDHQPCFLDDRDRRRYLDDLRVLARENACAVHAYVLMTNHVHLLLTPGPAGRVDRMMQALGRRYVRWFNDTHARSGTLWEGRYRSGPVHAEDYLLRCHRYIELNPVRAGLAPTAAIFRWSSYGANALGSADALVSPHPVYLALGASDLARQRAYREFVAESVPREEADLIRRQLHRQHPLGPEAFSRMIQDRTGYDAGPRRRGRPGKKKGAVPRDAAPSDPPITPAKINAL
jgi:putative transposase